VAERDRHRELREAMQEVRGAVERVDDPLVLVVALRAALLGEDRVVRVGAVDDADDLVLGEPVDLGDEVVALLGADGQPVDPLEVADDHVARAAGGTDRDVEHGVHDAARRFRKGRKNSS
jgi:hypothetical protein